MPKLSLAMLETYAQDVRNRLDEITTLVERIEKTPAAASRLHEQAVEQGRALKRAAEDLVGYVKTAGI